MAGSTGTKTKRKKRTVAKQKYQLVEIVEDGDSFIMAPLPIPEGADCSSRAPIMTAVKKAIASGDQTYDDKRITVVSYTTPVLVKAEAVITKRKVTFETQPTS